jgi:hypothetical protein
MRAEFNNIARMPCQIQTGGSDCVFFPVALAMSLAIGDDMSSVIFEKSQLAELLQNCSQNKKKNASKCRDKIAKRANAGIKKKFRVSVACSCRIRYSEKSKAIECV